MQCEPIEVEVLAAELVILPLRCVDPEQAPLSLEVVILMILKRSFKFQCKKGVTISTGEPSGGVHLYNNRYHYLLA